MLKKVISGFQTGADIGGIFAASDANIETGGWMPKGFRTLEGSRPYFAEWYGAKEHKSSYYPPRTYSNVADSDGTIRFYYDKNSAGEICTLKAISKLKKPYLDVDLNLPLSHKEVVDWIRSNNISVLNIAGNSEKTYGGITLDVFEYLTVVFKLLKENELVV